jgi:hypothetical protein
MRRLSDGWMGAYKRYIIDQESPSDFHFWISMMIIAAALRRNVWIDRGAYKLYPNMYTILTTASGMCRKGVAMEIGLDILRELQDIKVVYERTSLEGLMDLLNRMTIRPGTQIAVPDGSVLIVADELSDLFGKATYITDLMSFLTAAYSSRTRLEFHTRNKGVCTVRNPCVCMLCGTTPDQMGEIFPSTTLTSGFLGRTLMISGEREKRVSKPKIDYSMRDDLVRDLQDISQLYGEVLMTPEAEAYFTTWYEAMPPYKGDVLPAFYERRHDHALKAAIVMSVQRGNDMVINKDVLINAIMAVERIEDRLAYSLRFIGATSESVIADTIVTMIRNHVKLTGRPLKHSVIMQRVYKRVKNATEFNAMMDTLCQAGKISMTTTGPGGTYYTA